MSNPYDWYAVQFIESQDNFDPHDEEVPEELADEWFDDYDDEE